MRPTYFVDPVHYTITRRVIERELDGYVILQPDFMVLRSLVDEDIHGAMEKLLNLLVPEWDQTGCTLNNRSVV